MARSSALIHQAETIIQSIRGQRVILDSDLAAIYGVKTRVLNQAVKRNRKKFPKDFMFQLSGKEARGLYVSRSQPVILKRGGNIKYRPYAFTEYGALMAANVLKSPRAIQMAVFVVRAFIKMREMITGSKELAQRLSQVEKQLKERLDLHETAIVDILRRIMDLIDPPPTPEPEKRHIGY